MYRVTDHHDLRNNRVKGVKRNLLRRIPDDVAAILSSDELLDA
jgi:hypothetical protein